jgi:hypothetical protein
MHRIAITILGAVSLLTACDAGQPDPSEQELEQVLEEWTAPTEPEPPPQDTLLRARDGRVIPLPPMAPEPELLSDKFLVILASSDQPRHMPESLIILADHPQLMAQVQRSSSSWFQGLMPCFEITTIGAFEYRRQATALARQLDALGVDNYVKQAGRYVGSQQVVQAWCESEHSTVTAGCGDVHFAEVYDGKAWMLLPQDPVVIERALEGSPAPQPLGGLRAWSSPLGAETIDPYSRGQSWKLYAPGAAKALGKCKIESFAAITRGQPHWGYLEQQPEPTEPGCGSPELFARLSCKEPVDEPLLALPADHADPVLYTELAPLRNIELEDDVKAMVARTPAFGPAFAQAREDAEERMMPLQQLVTLRGFVAPGRKVLLVLITLQTGDGVVWCGADDVRVELAGVYEWTQDDGLGAELVPFHSIELAEVLGLIDIDADGVPELLQRRWPHELELFRVGQEQACSAPQDYCDCPC